MHYLIDGYNLLFSLSSSDTLRSKREHFLQTLQEHYPIFRGHITVVFDGKHRLGEESGYQYFSNFLVAFSSRTQTADEYILEKIVYSPHPSRFTVITEDQGLINAVRRKKAFVKSVHWFVAWVEKKAKKPPEKPEKETPFHQQRLQEIFQKELEKITKKKKRKE